MSSQMEPQIPQAQPIDEHQASGFAGHHKRDIAIKALVLVIIFALGAGSGYLAGTRIRVTAASAETSTVEKDAMTLMRQINPPEGYKIPAIYGDIGPRLVEAGAIDLAKFTSIYKQQNQPLTEEQTTILTEGSLANVEINRENAYFMLNFFWALGLTSENPILTEGKMVSRGRAGVGGFASTGGWTLGTQPATELYASERIFDLNDEQQSRLAEVAAGVYRPCCNNPTDFPDCNHGMALLGLLELMASQNATVEQMFEAAKYVNAFWFPQQVLEIAMAIKATQNVDFADAEGALVVGSQYSSGSGFQNVHQWLAGNGLLPQAPSSGGSCGVQ